MKKGEAEAAISHLVDKWVEQAKEPWPPDGLHHYSFGTFWTWLQDNYHQYTKFRAVPNARYVAEMWFDRLTKQTWRN
ncbi:hypothetical protein MA20_44335 [Bradyrhizobium japonicum]|uniref:Uncharacterized protein n=1 Tax=Bradyrhizobium japonicum TaxID=375 RepID=A0A0A3XGA4_BRAJP|nr:hypothetical protein [Bradyrhizobium japonicum]KGT73437.1 hypothetical protein MA20_44335 [Bradyrhizobium japonicum]MCW2224952.1 hypothetical protein [Bradyrhizobium japonicum]MCW2340165.1 hypothetical protein [Bradyrhizobium japonicum]